jgi:hypothetical protein
MAFLLDPNNKVDATNPDNLSERIAGEKETRRKILSYARNVGFEQEMLLLFAKYDKLLHNCKNDKEREDIRKLGAFEVYKLLGGGGELYVDGQLVYTDPTTPPAVDKGNKNE